MSRSICCIIDRMDAVHEAEETIDIGVCSDHNRVHECYCTECYCMICPSCLMFDRHKGHVVSKIEEGAKELRSKINSCAREGVLQFEKTESVLLDIRHARLSLQENAQAMITQAEKHFDELAHAVKARRIKFVEEIKAHFNEQLEAINKSEEEWIEKQEVSQKILKLQASTDDNKILQEASSIYRGLNKLAEPIKYWELKLLTSIESQVSLGKYKCNFGELVDAVNECLSKGKTVSNRIKC